MRNWGAHIVLLTVFWLTALVTWGQETLVVGEVHNRITGEPIGNCNIYFKRTQIGTTTNAEGTFILRTKEKHSGVLVISALGYKSEEYKVPIGEYKGLEVNLLEKNTVLPDLLVLPGANPAWELIKKLHLHRSENDLTAQTNRPWQARQEVQLFFSKLPPRMAHRADSAQLIPVYGRSEQITCIDREETITDRSNEQSNLLPTYICEQVTSPLLTSPNFYQNSIALADKQFISPLSTSGNNFYQYYLHDSILTPTGKQYHIRFRSKNSFNLTFSGDLYIDSATCALSSITAHVPSSANINFVRSIDIRQVYTYNGETYEKQDEQLTMLLDDGFGNDSTRHLFPSLLAIQHRTYNIKSMDSLMVVRPDSSSESEYTIPTVSQLLSAMDQFGQTRWMRFAKWAATTITTNYAPLGKYLDLGDVIQCFSFNRVETFRLGLPLRTSERLWKNLCLQGYVDYGFEDHAWKHMEQIQYQFPQTHLRHLIGAKYVDDYTRTDINWFNTFALENCLARGFMDFSTGILCVFPIYNFNRQRELSVFTYNDINRHWETKFAFRLGHFSYGDATAYHAWWRLPAFDYMMGNLQFRLSFDDQKIRAHLQRLYVYGRKPVLNLGLEAGGFRMPKEAEVLSAYSNKLHAYGKIHFTIQQRIPLGIVGEMHYLIEMGHIFGDVPYPFLQSFHGNETMAWDRYRFTNMNQSEFIADTYIDGHFRWNMGGILFNQIPGIRRLKLRELLAVKFAYGSLRPGHAQVLALPSDANYAGSYVYSEHLRTERMKVPYVEVSCGIGNILHILNVWSTWRLTNRNTTAPLWSVRLQFNLGT